MNVFYDQLLNIHELHLEFDRFDLEPAERNELMKLADSAVHHEVFDLIMVEIPEEHRAVFLERFSEDPGETELLVFVREKIPGFDEKVKERVGKILKELTEEVRKIK